MKNGHIILLLSALCILAMFLITGCPPNTDRNGDSTDSGVGTEQELNGQPVEGQDGGSASTMQPERAMGTESAGEEEFIATQERPLAPPAEPAAGSENAVPGLLSIMASVSGTGDPVPLMEGGITIQVGEEMKVQVTVANMTEEMVNMSFITAQKLDIFISDKEGNQVYQWSKGQRFPQVLSTLELGPGQTWSHEVTIPIGTGENMVPPGVYDIAIVLVGQPPLTFTASDLVLAQ